MAAPLLIEESAPPEPGRGRGASAPVVLAVMTGAWFLFHAALCERKLRYFLYNDIDLAIFTQAVDRLLHGSLYSSIRGMNWLGDHSSLILFLAAPIYAIARNPLTLLALQSAALALGAIPCFLLAKREWGDEKLALGCAALYLANPALGYVGLFEFHPEALATAPLLACFYFLRARRTGAALAFASLALLAKEDVALVVLALAAYAAFARPRSFRLAAGLAVLALGSLALSFAVFKPLLSSGEAEYGRMYAAWGGSAPEIAAGVARDPLRAVAAMFSTPGDPVDTRYKLEFFLHLLLPVGFFALASPATLAIGLPVLAEHLLSSRGPQHTIVYQYTALLTPFVFAATVLGLRNLACGAGRAEATARIGRLLLLAGGAALASQLMFGPVVGHQIAQTKGPAQSVFPDGGQRAAARYREALVRRVPANAPAVAGFEFLPRLASRETLHSLHHVVSGHYTYSSKPYPVLSGIEALIADFGDPRLPYGDAGGSQRLTRLLTDNHLVPVDAADDLVLFLRGGTKIPLIGPTDTVGFAGPARKPVLFEGELEMGTPEILTGSAPPGGRLEFVTRWRRRAPVQRTWLTRWMLLDAAGGIAHLHMRALGYVACPPSDWPVDVPFAETYRLVIPEDLAPGAYTLAVQVGWRRGAEVALAAADDPALASRHGMIALGPVQVAAPR